MTALQEEIVVTCSAEAHTAESATGSSAGASAAERTPRTLPRSLIDRIRREFFAKGRLAAIRYGITSDELIAHLEQVRLAATTGPGRVLSFIDDQILSLACSRGHPQAWHDAWEKHEAVLIRACRMRLGEGDAIVFTRRFWIDLYASTMNTAPNDLPPVGEFVAVRPLRIWLTDRLLGRLEVETCRAIAQAQAGAPSGLGRTADRILGPGYVLGSGFVDAGERGASRSSSPRSSLVWAPIGARRGKSASRVPFPNFGFSGEIRLKLVD